jgi:uncharacterized protein DUF6055
MYHSCYPLEYWSNKHGLEFIARLWREAQREEDPVLAYQRITGITQQQFNDEIFDACRRFVTWDMPRIEKFAARYANRHETTIIVSDDGWYRISPEKCPQNYGYNAIQLEVPAADTTVKLEFEGLVGVEGYSNIRIEKAGWRYGFLASLEDGSRQYGDMYSNAKGTGNFSVPEKTKHLWLVVMGAPSDHWIRQGGRRRRGGGGEGPADEQWPYRFRLEGTAPVKSVIQ